ncbi:MAG: pyridoxamine 5'-phosphate oxidase family protein [Burkholderiaceae bacterium]|nr:pyridoxamine 5'-phosphate oxidase family protein [Burkholderiaceae bacterium]
MQRSPQNTEGMERVAQLIDEIGVAMLTWADEGGALTSRPMMPLAMDEDGALWFFIRSSTAHLDAEGRVNLAFAQPDRAAYVSVSGRAALVDHRERIDRLWTALARPWFPEGKDDPLLTLLRVDVDDAEFWDASSSKMVRMARLAASVASGAPAGLGDTGKVTNPRFPSAVV